MHALNPLSKILLILIVFFGLVACGGGGGGSDTTAPQVSTTTPVDGAVDVDLDINPSVTFNEDMLGTSISDVEFTLEQGRTGVTATVQFDGASNIATLEPAATLALATPYTASLSAEIADLSGNPLEAFSWGFTTRDGQWQAAELIESDNNDASHPQIAIDSAGNALAVWQQSNGTATDIWANRFTPAGGWGTAGVIDNGMDDASRPQIAVDSAGNALAVWYQSDGTVTDIWANRFTPADGWLGAEMIDSAPGNAISAQIAFDNAGNALAVWYQDDGTQDSIWANRFTPTGGWDSTNAVMIGAGLGNARSAQIAIDDSGNALAVWEESDGTRFNIRANRFTPTGGWGTAELIETDDLAGAFGARIAIDNAGNALAVWFQDDSTQFNIWANRFTPADGWGSAEMIEADTGDAEVPQIAFDNNGNALAVWEQDDGTRYNIRANRFTPTDGWGVAELIETDNAGDATAAQIVIDNSGNALAVWKQRDGTRSNIWANRFTGSWGSAELIETDDSGGADVAQIAIDSTGNAVAVWRQADGTRNNIWANRFE